jgi:hypothetical protein
MRLRTSVVVVLGLLCPFVSTIAVAGDNSGTEPDERSADQIIALVTETYKSCGTYRDSGVATTLFIHPDGRTDTEKQPFTTAFVRPGRFRFEYRHEFFQNQEKPGTPLKPNRHIIWRQGQDVRTWWDIRPGVETQSSLHLALAGAYGVSSASSGEIPALLLPQEVSGGRLRYLHEPTRLQNAELGNVNCIRIQGQDYETNLVTFWIDSNTLLIRRVDSGHDFGSFRTEVTMTYNPVINDPIPEEKLAFDPPTEDAADANQH